MLWAISGVGVFEFLWLGWLQPGCSLLPRPGRRQRRKFPSRYRYRQWSPPHGAAVNCSCTWTCPHLKLLSVVLKHGLKGNEIIKPINLLALLLSSVPLIMGELFHP